MERKGILTVVSGFSGAGKGTLMRGLIKEYGQTYALSISATTRKPRIGEAEGREYFFKTKEEFERMVANEELIEHARYVGNYYGTPRFFVERQLAEGKDVLLEIETDGGLQVRRKYPQALLLFVTAPSAAELKRRLVMRGTESEKAIASRMARSVKEAEAMGQYDYLLVNGDLKKCMEEMHGIIQAEHRRCVRNTAFINEIKRGLENNLKGE